jgi:PhnB protein
MATAVPYLFFPGNAEEAIDFYKGVFGAETRVQGFDTFPSPDGSPPAPGVMHADLWLGEFRLFASDGMPGGEGKPFSNPEICIAADTAEDAAATAWFSALSEGGEVEQALEAMPWGDKFGRVIDKYGVSWMFNVGDSSTAGPQEES